MDTDLRMLLSAALALLLMAGILHFQAASFPANILGLREWGKGFFLNSAAAVMACCGEDVLGPLSLLMVIILMQSGLAYLYAGTCLFHERKPRLRLLWTCMGTVFVLMASLLFVWPTSWVRVTVVSFTNTALFVLILRHAVRGRPGEQRWRFSRVYAVVLAFLIASAWAARGVWALITKPEAVPQIPVVMNQFMLSALPTLVILSGTSLLLMAFDRLKDELEYLVSHDALTGAFSRRGFLSLAASEHSRATRMQRPLALLVLDLDHFKQINDRYGHPAGDQVLQHFVDTARSCLRREDLLSRYGGEEFMVLLPDTSLSSARVVAERIRTAIAASRVSIAHHAYQVRFSVSIGIACSDDKRTLDDLLKLGDSALYQAKSKGRNRVEVA